MSRTHKDYIDRGSFRSCTRSPARAFTLIGLDLWAMEIGSGIQVRTGEAKVHTTVLVSFPLSTRERVTQAVWTLGKDRAGAPPKPSLVFTFQATGDNVPLQMRSSFRKAFRTQLKRARKANFISALHRPTMVSSP